MGEWVGIIHGWADPSWLARYDVSVHGVPPTEPYAVSAALCMGVVCVRRIVFSCDIQCWGSDQR